MTTHRTLRVSAMVAVSLLAATSGARAGTIENACRNSQRVNDMSVCSCIQGVANQILTSSDQRLAAKFFRDPQKAQDVRMSSTPDHEQFWARYVAFGDTASRVCS